MWYKFSKQFISYHDARTWASERNIKSKEQFRATPRPENIPYNPEKIYPEWVSWKDFLNKFAPYPMAQQWALQHGIKTQEQWFNTQKPLTIPDDPSKIYIFQWDGWDKFLGTQQKIQWATYEEAKQWAAEHNIKTQFEWRNDPLRPLNMPFAPEPVYKNDWTSWFDFLPHKDQNIRSIFKGNTQEKTNDVNVVKDWVKKMGITSYEQWIATPKPAYIPEKVIALKNWKGWGDLFGVEIPRPQFATYEEAKQWSIANKIKTGDQWKATPKPANLPQAPNEVYKDKGWTTWANFLSPTNADEMRGFWKKEPVVRQRNNNPPGAQPQSVQIFQPPKQKGSKPSEPQYPTYEVLHKWLQRNNITNLQQYKAATKPENFPNDPADVYNNWKGFPKPRF